MSSSTSELILQALLAAQEKDILEAMKEQDKANYELNPADIIAEEDLEESTGEMSFRKMSKLGSISLKEGNILDIRTHDQVEALLKEEGMETERMIKRKQEIDQQQEELEKEEE